MSSAKQPIHGLIHRLAAQDTRKDEDSIVPLQNGDKEARSVYLTSVNFMGFTGASSMSSHHHHFWGHDWKLINIPILSISLSKMALFFTSSYMTATSTKSVAHGRG